MVYRIRYSDARADGQGEAVVEAENPVEALVKFRHTHQISAPACGGEHLVTSIMPDPSEVEVAL